MRAWREANIDKARASEKRRRDANREKYRGVNRRLRAADPEKYRADTRRRRGLPEPTRQAPPVCECCGRPPDKRGLALDHCHVSRVFRGWLCFSCNTGIGALGDNVAGLEKAVAYLKAHGSEHLL